MHTSCDLDRMRSVGTSCISRGSKYDHDWYHATDRVLGKDGVSPSPHPNQNWQAQPISVRHILHFVHDEPRENTGLTYKLL